MVIRGADDERKYFTINSKTHVSCVATGYYKSKKREDPEVVVDAGAVLRNKSFTNIQLGSYKTDLELAKEEISDIEYWFYQIDNRQK